jgi:putative nucleotidyltransferase with HDIG domain
MIRDSIYPPDTDADVQPPPAATANARIEHLFRGARSSGRIHPLQHLLQRHRAEQPAPLQPTRVAPVGQPQEASTPLRIDHALVLQRVRELPPLSRAALDALEALRDPQSSAERCADVMGRDQALVARTLRLANSAFYGVPGRVANMRDAVNLLGRRTLVSAVTVATLSPQFVDQSCPDFSFGGFWRHAIAVALAARGVARALHAPEETAFTAGLLHDVGRLALAAHFPQDMAQAIHALKGADRHHALIERQVLGTDHVDVGVLIAAHWNFPTEVIEAITGHHAPSATPDSGASLADMVHVADAIAHALDLAGETDELVPALDLCAWDRLGLSTQTALAIFNDTEAGVAQLSQAMGL